MGFSQAEWLEDPVRWYDHIHPEDRDRWSVEAAEMFLTGKPLRSRVSGARPRRPPRLVPVRSEDGAARRRATLVHPRRGLRHHRAQAGGAALAERAELLSAVLDTVGALVVVLSPSGAIVRFNRTLRADQRLLVRRGAGPLLLGPVPRAGGGPGHAGQLLAGAQPGQQRGRTRSDWTARRRSRRRIAWSNTSLPGAGRSRRTSSRPGSTSPKRKRMETALLEVGGREQRADRPGPPRRVGPAPDRHRLHEQGAGAAAAPRRARLRRRMRRKIVRLVNEAINKTRELARGLLPVFSDAEGLMSALQQ